MQQALAMLDGDPQVKANLRFCIDRLHECDHRQEGVLSRSLGGSATRLEQAIKDAESGRPKP